MKELSIEQKAERYDEISKEVKDFFDGKQKMYSDVKQTLNHLFPELKESEDDRIRKDIIRVLKGEISFTSEKENEKYIAWLEKQGEKPQGKSALEAAKEEKVDNQNCVKPTNNPEPKFREGDWLIENHPNNYARFVQILEIVNVQGNNKYRISRDLHNNEDVAECLFIEDNWHPFNIQDAKDGDVLASKDGVNIVIFRNLDSSTSFSSYYNIKRRGERGWSNDSFIPATKEQRDLLFQKMSEAGYEWDADKKELKIVDWSKHIKYNPNATSITEEKSDWNEKDEKIRQTIINEFEQCSEWYCSNGLTKEDCINWLNKQEHFKCADEDNEKINSLCVLLDQMVGINVIGNEHSIEYKNWLKSLKERIGG